MKCSVDFTETGRRKFAKYLGITHCICVTPSLICLLSALYIQIIIEDKISFIEDYNGAILPGVLVFTGFFGLVAHVVCGKIFWINKRPEKREKWSRHLLIAVILTFVIFLLEVCSSVVCFAHISSLEDSFHKGIKSAMISYKNDAERKAQLDTLQMTYECCGSRAYTDWFYIGWIHPDFMSTGSKYALAHRGKSGKGFISDDVPFSCCNPSAMRPCISHHLQDDSLHYNYEHAKDLTVYRNGCTNVLMNFYQDGVLVVIGVVILCLSFVQAVASVAGRFLQTAILEAMAHGDGQGPSVGYIIKCGPTTPKSEEQQSLLDSTGDSVQTEAQTDTTTNSKMIGDDENIYTTIDESLDETFETFDTIDEPSYMNLPQAPPPPPPAPPPPPISFGGAKTRELSYDDGGGYENVPVGLKQVKSRRGSYMSMMNHSTPIHKGIADANKSRLGSGVSFNMAKNAIDRYEHLNASSHNNSLDEIDSDEGEYWIDPFGKPVRYPQTSQCYLPGRPQSKSNYPGDDTAQLQQQRKHMHAGDNSQSWRRPTVTPFAGHTRSRSVERPPPQSEMQRSRSRERLPPQYEMQRSRSRERLPPQYEMQRSRSRERLPPHSEIKRSRSRERLPPQSEMQRSRSRERLPPQYEMQRSKSGERLPPQYEMQRSRSGERPPPKYEMQRSRSRERLPSQSEMHRRRSSVSPLKRSPSRMITRPLSPYRTSTPKKAMIPETRQSVSTERSYERRHSSGANRLSYSDNTPQRSRANKSPRSQRVETPSKQRYRRESNQDSYRRRSEPSLNRRTSSSTQRRKSNETPSPRKNRRYSNEDSQLNRSESILRRTSSPKKRRKSADVSVSSRRRSSSARGDRTPTTPNRSVSSQKGPEKQRMRTSSSGHARRQYESSVAKRRDQSVRRTVDSPPRRRSSSVPRATSMQRARTHSSGREGRQRSKSVQAIRTSSPSKSVPKSRHSSDRRVERSRR